MKRLCSENYCYNNVNTNDFVVMFDGSFHPSSTKCGGCETKEDRKKVKAYKKNRRKAENKLCTNSPLTPLTKI